MIANALAMIKTAFAFSSRRSFLLGGSISLHYCTVSRKQPAAQPGKKPGFLARAKRAGAMNLKKEPVPHEESTQFSAHEKLKLVLMI